MEEDMDQLSPNSASLSNPHFDKAGRAKEFDDERDHHAKIVSLLQRHLEVAARLTEVQDEEEEDDTATDDVAGPSLTAT